MPGPSDPCVRISGVLTDLSTLIQTAPEQTHSPPKFMINYNTIASEHSNVTNHPGINFSLRRKSMNIFHQLHIKLGRNSFGWKI